MTDVTTLMSDTQAFANSWVNQAESFIGTVADLSSITYDIKDPISAGYSPDNPAAEIEAKVVSAAGAVAAPAITLEMPEPPSIPAAVDFGTAVDIAVPEFDGATPDVVLATAPTMDLPSPPSGAPDIVMPTLPEAPTIAALPDVPTLTTITLPEPPAIEFPYFDGVAPDIALAPPSETFDFQEKAYQSDLLDAVRGRVQGDLTTGNYGIDTEDERLMWDRAGERDAAATRQAIADAEHLFANRGFALPPGALFQAGERARLAQLENETTLNRDIAIKRADLFVQNRRFAIEKAIDLESMAIQFHGSVMERLLNASKYVVEAAIAKYNAQVADANLRLDKYRTEAQVFETMLRAAVQRLESYRAELEAARMVSEIDRGKIEAYRAQVGAIETVVGLYTARMNAARVAADIEHTKLEAYRSQIEAYVATVRAKETEFSAYESSVRGEMAKVQLYESTVRAYAARIDGLRAKADVENTKLRTKVEQGNYELNRYRADIDRFRVSLAAETDEARLGLEVYQQEMSKFRALVDAYTAVANMETNSMDTKTREFIEVMNYNLRRAGFQLEKLDKETDVKLGAAKFGSEFYSSIVSGALSSINALAIKQE